MILGRKGRGTRVRFAMEGARRVVTVEGSGLPEVEQRRLRRLLRAVPIATGVVTIRSDASGARRVTFSREIPDPLQQVVRNIVGNLARLA